MSGDPARFRPSWEEMSERDCGIERLRALNAELAKLLSNSQIYAWHAFSSDPLQHAANVIEEMKAVAIAALAIAALAKARAASAKAKGESW